MVPTEVVTATSTEYSALGAKSWSILYIYVYKHLASLVRSSFTLMKTQDWVETSVYFFDNDICPTISASGVSLSVVMLVPSHAEFFQMIHSHFSGYYFLYSHTHIYACITSFYALRMCSCYSDLV